MTLYYDHNLDYCVADVITYATDPLLQDKIVKLHTATKEVFRAGSLIDSSTGSLATASTISQNLFVLLEKTRIGQETISCAYPFGVELKTQALLANEKAALTVLLPMLQAQGFGIHDCGIFAS
ncbi:hypothetical protein [Serratia sp. D1N4]